MPTRTSSAAQRFTLDSRSAGVLLHLTSLPGPHGCGDLGAEAITFIDFLRAAGQRWWQMLPIGPIGPGNSPYSAASSFGGNPLLVDLRALHRDGLLDRADLDATRGIRDGRVHYKTVIPFRMQRLRQAFDRFAARGGLRTEGFCSFCQMHAAWLDDYAIFCAARHANRGKSWTEWPAELRQRRVEGLRRAQAELRDGIDFVRFVQFAFDQQWSAFRRVAHAAGVGLLGDIPIFVAHDSADVWANQKLFQLDRSGRPKAQTGCPPDHFNPDGQLWGHPQYNWSAHERTGFGWWISRIERVLQQFDAVRIDHFLGFHRVWSIPANAQTARTGRWIRSPGRAFLTALRRALGRVNIIAEDLGLGTPEASSLRDEFDFPGMRVMLMGFGGDGAGSHFHLPHAFVPHCVAYSGTHDNETAVGWLERVRRSPLRTGATPSEKRRPGSVPVPALSEFDRIRRYFDGAARELHWQIIRALYASVANTVVIPMQDLLGLGAPHRMNTPGLPEGNWEWRLLPDAADEALALRLRNLATACARI